MSVISVDKGKYFCKSIVPASMLWTNWKELQSPRRCISQLGKGRTGEESGRSEVLLSSSPRLRGWLLPCHLGAVT